MRGYRVEPGEVEAALTRFDEVAQAAVVARGGALTGYVVGRAGARPDLSALRSRLAATLPAHLVPSPIVALDALPLSPNGKVDRAALPAPVSPEEAALRRRFADVLDRPVVHPDDAFFELGGHFAAGRRTGVP